MRYTFQVLQHVYFPLFSAALLLGCQSATTPLPARPIAKPPQQAEAPMPIAPTPKPPSTSALRITTLGVEGITKETQASELSLQSLFPDLRIEWRREKGQATPHWAVFREGSHLMDVVQTSQGRQSSISMVRMYRSGRTEAGLTIGDSYTRLREVLPDLVCHGIPARPIKNGVIHRPYSFCATRNAPQVQYVFHRVVFSNGQEPEDPSALQIDEIRWVVEFTSD